MKPFCKTLSLACLTLTLVGAHARAQYPYPPRPGYGYPPGYVNPYYGSGAGMYGYGNALNGYANLNTANSTSMINVEQARMVRQKTEQEKINTKKQAFDEMMYEKAHTPTYGETLDKDKAAILKRMINHPITSEITDGKTLNVMLPYVQSLASYGGQGPPIPISQQYIGALNVRGSTGSSGSVGILRDGGVVEWPIGLQGPQQKKLDKLLPAAYNATISGKLTPMLMRQVRAEMKSMRESLRTQLQKEEIETSSYLRAIEFYNSLDSSVNALESPDARKQLNGTYAARGRNVQELVDHMTENGLRFAPAAPGSENAYQAVHDAFVRYSRTVESTMGPVAMQQGLQKK